MNKKCARILRSFSPDPSGEGWKRETSRRVQRLEVVKVVMWISVGATEEATRN